MLSLSSCVQKSPNLIMAMCMGKQMRNSDPPLFSELLEAFFVGALSPQQVNKDGSIVQVYTKLALLHCCHLRSIHNTIALLQ